MLNRARLMKEENGFTLIELLIVIVILGVLSAVVVFSVQGITDRGEDAACAADKSTIAVAAEAYYAQNSAYPANTAALVGTFLQALPTGASADFSVTPYTIACV